MQATIRISHYSNEQLLNCLVNVDDEAFFENALLIYRSLLERRGWHHSEVNAGLLGFENDWFLEFVNNSLFGVPLIGGVLNELYIENHQMKEKIARLNIYLTHQDSNNT